MPLRMQLEASVFPAGVTLPSSISIEKNASRVPQAESMTHRRGDAYLILMIVVPFLG